MKYLIIQKDNWIELRYKQRCSEDEFIASHEEMIKMNSSGHDRLLIDIRALGVISVKAQNYVVKSFLPKMKELSKTGQLKEAVILSSDSFQTYAAQTVNKKIEAVAKGIDHRLFSDEQQALDWLIVH